MAVPGPADGHEPGFGLPPVTWLLARHRRHLYDPPERFVVGTVGEPGQRTFYLQARAGTRTTTVALEKQQVQVLAERVEELLDEVFAAAAERRVPAVAPLELDDLAPLEMPVTEDFRVGAMSLSWDGDTERVVIEAEPSPARRTSTSTTTRRRHVLRVRWRRRGANEPRGRGLRAAGRQARAGVRAGLPPSGLTVAARGSLPFCGNPIEPCGHL